jgi:16S rRNA (guanine966-N2)-methyltransferase
MAKRISKNDKDAAAASRRTRGDDLRPVAGLRVIGGQYRGRRLHYTGDFRTRPMKDRLREAVFNLLGNDIRGKHAIDLFAGTGALGIEALSRGAARATFCEQHHPTAAVIRQNITELGADDRAAVVPGNTFIWWQKQQKNAFADLLADAIPWAVFCSPPYAFYVDRAGEMLELIAGLAAAAPAGSVFAVEADDRFDFCQLPAASEWDVRAYPPAVVGIWRKET